MHSSPQRSTAMVASMTLLLTLMACAAAGPVRAGGLPSKSAWLRDVAVVMKPAIPYLDERVAQGGTKLAVVLDIDNTSIATQYAWPRPVRKTRAFARHARSLGVTVFFVTGRRQADALAQRPMLRRAGYPVAGICGRRSGEHLAQGKTRCRKTLVKRGFTIIASVGNLRTDFKGGYAERTFDLPDYHHVLS